MRLKLLSSAAVAAIACLASCSTAEFKPRIVNSGGIYPAATEQLLADAKMQFRLGNFALALDHFRKAARQSPDSVAAYNGLAACYDRLGRFDLSRRYYEEALALAPEDAKVRHNFAVSLRMQGKQREALAFEAETEALKRLDVAIAEQDAVADSFASPVGPSISIRLPAPAPIEAAKTASAAGPAVGLERISLVEVSLRTAPPEQMRKPAGAVSIALPAAKPVVTALAPRVVPPAPAVPEAEPAPVLAAQAPPPQPVRVFAPPARPAAQPARIVSALAAPVLKPARMLAALATTPALQPARILAAKVVEEKPAPAVPASPVRVQMANGTWEPLRVMNAVGRVGQAGRMRTYLAGKGWDRVAIGDSAQRRARSILLYPAGSEAMARKLASQLPFRVPVVASPRATRVVLLLGLNAAPFDDRLRRGRGKG